MMEGEHRGERNEQSYRSFGRRLVALYVARNSRFAASLVFRSTSCALAGMGIYSNAHHPISFLHYGADRVRSA
jgi:hypothetical protein